MAEEKSVNKVIFGGETLIDLTADTVDAASLLTGKTAHDKSGEVINGACTFDSDTSDATVAEAEMLVGKTAYARGAKLTGTMPNNGSVTGVIEEIDEEYEIPQGYHDGSGKVSIKAEEQAKLIPENIRNGVTILNVLGTMSGSEDVSAQAKVVVPKLTSQVILPDTPEYNYLTQVTVDAIPYIRTENAAGGITAIIAPPAA